MKNPQKKRESKRGRGKKKKNSGKNLNNEKRR